MSEEKDDIQKLIAKRDELLGEVKKLKARVAELEGERDTATTRADTAEGDLRRVRLDDPVTTGAYTSVLFTPGARGLGHDCAAHCRGHRG